MPFNKNDLERIQDQLQQGKMTADQANVQIVRQKGVKLILNRLPANVRRSLNAAVKAGELGHLRKDGLKPEAYFHPNSASRARQDRENHENEIREDSRSVVSVNQISNHAKARKEGE